MKTKLIKKGLFIFTVVSFCFLACWIIVITDNDTEQEKTISLTAEDFMLVYYNGYEKGIQNGLTSNGIKQSDLKWQEDSLWIRNALFKE